MGGIFIAWEDYRRGVPYENIPQVDVYLQRITATGESALGWPSEGIAVCTAPNGKNFPRLLPDGSGGVFLEWEDGRVPDSFDIYATRVAASGTIAPGWPVDGLPLCLQTGHQGSTAIAVASDGGFIAAWQDERLVPPGQSSFLYVDIYAQKVTVDGVIAPGWPADGAPVCTAPYDQQGVNLVSDGAGGALIAWSDYRNYFETAADLYVQRIGPDGQPALGWPVDGLGAARSPSFELDVPGIATDGMGGAILAYWVYSPDDIYGQHVRGNGSIGFGWGPNGNGICTAPDVQYGPVSTSDGEGGLIVAWEDGRNPGYGYDIYAQKVTVDFPTDARPAVRLVAEPGEVRLTWRFTREHPEAASVERRSESSGWETIGAATTDGREFQYVDTQPPAGRVAYRLSYATVRGTEFTPETWATVPSAHALGLIVFAPNPATGRSARVGFTLPGNVAAHLAVYDAAGREMFAREVGSLGPGRHSVEIGSATLASGLYWVQLRHGGETLRSRGVVVR